MNNFAAYLSPEQLHSRGSERTLAELRALATRRTRGCTNCDEREWKLGGLGMCFSCTTGESDASGDYEVG